MSSRTKKLLELQGELEAMGSIPLLSREREIFLAKQIELCRKRFRREMLESDFALSVAMSASAIQFAVCSTDCGPIRYSCSTVSG